MSIYTRSGDNGMTSVNSGKVKKYSTRIHVEGNLDELNSYIGIVIASIDNQKLIEIKDYLITLQKQIFDLSTDIYNPEYNLIKEDTIKLLELKIDEFSSNLEPLKGFILPGGSLISSHLHVARTICRRAERYIVELSEEETVNKTSLQFINRLSDLIFTLARYINKLLEVNDINR